VVIVQQVVLGLTQKCPENIGHNSINHITISTLNQKLAWDLYSIIALALPGAILQPLKEIGPDQV
jgi:hypothetical protein